MISRKDLMSEFEDLDDFVMDDLTKKVQKKRVNGKKREAELN